MNKEKVAQRKLAALRRDIVTKDKEILHALAGRFKIVKQIGRLKNQVGLPIKDLAQEAKHEEIFLTKAKNLGISLGLASKLLRFIRLESIRMQKS